nr:hypothetical protein [Tanacetum cinerariifolium]
DNGSFVDKIIFRAPDSSDQFHCFYCKDVLRYGEASKRCTCAKCGSGLGKGLCYICGHNQNSLNDSPSISETSSQSPPNINHCCYECGDPLDGIFYKCCTCKSCGKDAHIGYNCPSKVSVISNLEPCDNQTVDELLQTLPMFHPTFHSEAESPFTLDSTPTYVDESPNVFNPPPQPPVYPCEFCGNGAYYGHYCTPQAPFIFPEPCYNQDFNFQQDFQIVPQQYPCCEDCGVTHDAYQCQPMNEVNYYGQNSCYDSTSIDFDQSQHQQYTVDHPIFNAHNSYLDSQIQLYCTLAQIKDQMTSITSLCEMACQFVQKKLEKKQLEEERATKAKYWKLPVCYDDDDDEERSDSLNDNIIYGLPSFSAITPDEPVLSTEEPDNSLSMGDEHLDTILATESDEFIKSGVENLIPIPGESEGIPEHVCDVPSHDNSPPLDVSKYQFEDFFESNEEFSSIDDDSFSIDDIDYVEASPPDSELVSSEVIEIVIPEVGGINDDILLMIEHDVLREKLLNVNLLISKIEALNANPTPSSDCKTKSSYTSLNSLLEETNTFDNSLPGFKTFCFDVEEISSGSTATHPDISLPKYEAFHDDHVKEFSSGMLNIKLLIAKIEALNDNPTPSFDFMTKSSSTSLNSLLGETNTFDNSLLEFETFCFDLEEISSGSTTTPSDISLLKYEAFYDDHVKEISSGSTTTHSDSSLYDSFIFYLSINPFPLANM